MELSLTFLLALVILKIFSKEFVPIGTVFTVYGVIVLLIAWYRRAKTVKLISQQHAASENRNGEEIELFETSGSSVVLLTVVSLGCYIALIVLLYLM